MASKRDRQKYRQTPRAAGSGRPKANGIDAAAPSAGRRPKPRPLTPGRRFSPPRVRRPVREGQPPAGDCDFFRCERPGCEEWFIRTSHSPCQRFCSPSCRQALRRVLERERQWRKRASGERAATPPARAVGHEFVGAACPRAILMPTLQLPREGGRSGRRDHPGPSFPFSNPAPRRQGNEFVLQSVRCVPCGWTNSAISFAAIGSECRRPWRRWRSRCAAGDSARRSWRCLRDEKPQVLDGFTRWEAARQVRGMTTLSVRLIDVDDRRAKAAIYGLNQTGRRPHELEEAWIVRALVREDGLSQAEVAELLGRHKSWVCRRLALLEKLCTRRCVRTWKSGY